MCGGDIVVGGMFGGHSAKAVFGELGRHMAGRYMGWRRIVRWTFLSQVAMAILFGSALISMVVCSAVGRKIGFSLSSNAEWKGMNVLRAFGGNYQKFIDEDAVKQSHLLAFAAYVFFARCLVWSLVLVVCVYGLKLRLSSAILSASTEELPLGRLALDVALNPLPLRSYGKMKGMEVPDVEKKIDLSKVFGRVGNLQGFPEIEEGKDLVRAEGLSFNYGGGWIPGKWRRGAVGKFLSRYVDLGGEEGRAALENINLRISPSRFTSVLGCNGSSKSTLLKAIIHLFEDYSGEIFWADRNLERISHKSFYRNVAYIGQETIIQNKITVYDYVACGLFPSFSLLRFSYPQDHPVILKNLERMGILHHRDRDINDLSGGEKQKAVLARVLTQGTQVIILDEPTTYLDIRNQYLILNILKRLQLEENKTIVTILHDIGQAEQFSDEVILLDGGRIYAAGKTEEVITGENVERVFGIPWG